MSFEGSNFSWEINNLRLKIFCSKQNFKQNFEKSRVYALTSDTNWPKIFKILFFDQKKRPKFGEGQINFPKDSEISSVKEV